MGEIFSIIVFIAGLTAFVYFIYRYRHTEEVQKKRLHGRNAYISLVIVSGEIYIRIVEAFPDLKFLVLIAIIAVLLKATELFRGKRK